MPTKQPRRPWIPELQPIYDFGRECYEQGMDKVQRDVAVAQRFGNVDAYLDVATEGYYDAQEDREGVTLYE